MFSALCVQRALEVPDIRCFRLSSTSSAQLLCSGKTGALTDIVVLEVKGTYIPEAGKIFGYIGEIADGERSRRSLLALEGSDGTSASLDPSAGAAATIGGADGSNMDQTERPAGLGEGVVKREEGEGGGDGRGAVGSGVSAGRLGRDEARLDSEGGSEGGEEVGESEGGRGARIEIVDVGTNSESIGKSGEEQGNMQEGECRVLFIGELHDAAESSWGRAWARAMTKRGVEPSWGFGNLVVVRRGPASTRDLGIRLPPALGA